MGSPWKEGDIRLEVDKLKYRKCIFKHIVKQSSCVKCCFELNMIKGRLEKTIELQLYGKDTHNDMENAKEIRQRRQEKRDRKIFLVHLMLK